MPSPSRQMTSKPGIGVPSAGANQANTFPTVSIKGMEQQVSEVSLRNEKLLKDRIPLTVTIFLNVMRAQVGQSVGAKSQFPALEALQSVTAGNPGGESPTLIMCRYRMRPNVKL